MTLKDSLNYEPAELSFGTSGLRALVSDMTDLECFINTTGFLRFLSAHDALAEGETIYVGGDLRDSTDRIMRVVVEACRRYGVQPVNCGLLPTPAIAFYALHHSAPCIMVTGSHIPSDRNGIKFYKREGEVLKADEVSIKEQVAVVRAGAYGQNSDTSSFTSTGALKASVALPPVNAEGEKAYKRRFETFFPTGCLKGQQIVVYQQSAVGRDSIVDVLTELGAKVVAVERSDTFMPIDTENVTEENKAKFQQFATDYPGTFAIVSTDGDSDRPFVIDETGTFHRGDILGGVVADYLGATFAAVPISSNDAVDVFCRDRGITLEHTRIGSPYVIAAMSQAPADGPRVSWEVNGGFLTEDRITVEGRTLERLPTRDALLPILCAILSALAKHQKLSELFAALPARYTAASLIDNVDPGKIARFREVCANQAQAKELMKKALEGSELGSIDGIDLTDGLRMLFSSHDVVHLRPSGNAPQFRVYTNADSQARADNLAEQAVAPNGYIEKILAAL